MADGFSAQENIRQESTASSDQRPANKYTLAQIRFHWVVVLLVTLQLLVGIRIGTMPDGPDSQAFLGPVLVIHAIIGTIIFGVMVARLKLRRRVGAPSPPAGTPDDAALLARINHYGFYVLLLLMPVLGWLAYAFDSPDAAFFGSIHGALAVVLVLAICAHIAGVIYHSDIRRDGLAGRMAFAKLAEEVPDASAKRESSVGSNKKT
jgi:cytochrome b561